MTDAAIRELCVRVLRIQGKGNFTMACRFIADCADIEFFRVVRVCQGLA